MLLSADSRKGQLPYPLQRLDDPAPFLVLWALSTLPQKAFVLWGRIWSTLTDVESEAQASCHLFHLSGLWLHVRNACHVPFADQSGVPTATF